MIKIDLSEYKNNIKYLQLFEVLIKEKHSNKDEFLTSIRITPSTFRRAKEGNSKHASQIVRILANHFNLKYVDDSLIDKLEEKLNNIYFNIYYEIKDTFDDDLEEINNLLNENYIIFPILLMFKMLMKMNDYRHTNDFVNRNMELYKKIEKYRVLYNENLEEFYDVIEMNFQEKPSESYLSKKYKNELANASLARRCMILGKYIEGLYFSNLALERFVKTNNFKRIIFTNLTIISLYNNLERYLDAYYIGITQYYAVKAINDEQLKSTVRQLSIACIGLKKYDFVLELFKSYKNFNITELICYLISAFNVDKDDYIETYDWCCNEENGKYKELLISLDKYLKGDKKELIKVIDNYNVTTSLIKILKNVL